MTRVTPEIDFVRITDPGEGDPIAEAAAKLMLQGIQNIESPTHKQILDTISLEINGTLCLAAVNSDGLVLGTGGLLLERDGRSRAEIINMAVSPQERGRGLGRKIMSELEKEATRQGAVEIFGQPESEALGFYQRLGCQREENDLPFVRGEVLVKTL